MSFGVSMQSPDLERQIEMLKLYPEIAEAHFRPAVEASVALLAGRIRTQVPVLTGRAQQTMVSKVTGKGVNITGKVGWIGKNAPWYINVVEYGARAHALQKGSDNRSKMGRGKVTRRAERGQLAAVPVLISGVGWRTITNHPGFQGRGFMKAGFEASKPEIDNLLAGANEAIARELAVP